MEEVKKDLLRPRREHPRGADEPRADGHPLHRPDGHGQDVRRRGVRQGVRPDDDQAEELPVEVGRARPRATSRRSSPSSRRSARSSSSSTRATAPSATPTARATAAPRRASSRASRSSCPTRRTAGRILFLVMTNRPDKLDVDLKRAGRLDRKIPFLYSQTPEEVEQVARALVAQEQGEDRRSTSRRSATTFSAKLVGYSNADVEAVVLMANDDAAREAGGDAPVTARALRARRGRLLPRAATSSCSSTWSCSPSSRRRAGACCRPSTPP